MPQFDFLIIFPLIWSLLISLILYYGLSMKVLIPSFFGIRKFREKKISWPSFSTFFKTNPEITKSGTYLNLF